MVGVCRTLLNTGSCNDDLCRFHHDIHICEACSVVCLTGDSYQAHLAGKNHRKTLQRVAHAQAHGIDTEFCELCQMPIFNNNWERHQRTRRHANKQRFLAFKSLLGEAEKDKHGVSVSAAEGVDFGIIEVEEAQVGRRITFVIATSVPYSNVHLVDVKLTSTSNRGRISPFSVDFTANKIIYGRETRVTIDFTQSYRGRYEDRAEIIFEDTQLGKEFVIVRPLRAIVGSREDHATLRPTAPYVPRRRTKRAPVNEVVPGVAPESNTAIRWKVSLPPAEIPPYITLLLKYGTTKAQIENIQRSALPRTFDAANYGRHFKVLLWAEEFQMEKDLERYDIPDGELQQHGRYYYLAVPGLAEKRPSVLKGDTIIVQPHGETKWFEGFVHVLRQYEVGLCFGGSFRIATPRQKFSVRFRLNRIPIRRQHQAMDTVFEQNRILFPDRRHFVGTNCPGIREIRRVVYNPDIGLNEAQLQAIASILALPPGSPPFCVFGPPGTGKTVTIVEAIRQLLRQNPLTKILACAPSNSAADIIAEKLATVLSPDELFRFYAPSRSKEACSSKLENYTCRVEQTYTVPPMSRMTRFRVIVSTCVSASVFHGIAMQRGHFGHIFIDEAGQATEPEVMIAVKTMADNSTRVVLSGDHKQLGPIIRSNVARALGLETSYLERLMIREGYDEKQDYGISVVKLVKNFRSHEAILKFPNESFYRGDLQAFASRQVIDSFINKAILPNPRFPILFHGIVGKDDRDASSPSFFNVDEVTQIKDYVMKLKEKYRTTDHEIGIITPYHAQVLKVRTSLRGYADEVKIGSVEEFQGQERKVIIISTVRSSSEYIDYDVRHTLGFVAHPRRFNVAVTRAKALLIVVGNPEVLSLDPMWRSFLNYVRRNNGCIGAEITWDYDEEVDLAGDYAGGYRNVGIDDMNALTARLQERALAKASAEGVESDDEGGNVDRPWRDAE